MFIYKSSMVQAIAGVMNRLISARHVMNGD